MPFAVVDQGADSARQAYDKAKSDGCGFIIVDAILDRHLVAMGEAAADHRLITGGSGVAMGLPGNFIRKGLMTPSEPGARLLVPKGRSAILAGSCSVATRGQVKAAVEAGIPAFRLDPFEIAAGRVSHREVAVWADGQREDKPFLVYSSDGPESVRAVQDKLGRHEAGAIVERELAALAVELVKSGVARMIVAGGETSGAVVNGLGIASLEIGPEIDPGVPWCRAVGRDLVVALKSGNFGASDFFVKAWERLS